MARAKDQSMFPIIVHNRQIMGTPQRMKELSRAGFVPTTPGEQEDARRWKGADVYCGKCGALEGGPLFIVKCRCEGRC